MLWLVHSLIQYPQVVGDGLEKDTCLHMEVRAKCQEQQRIRLLQELKQVIQGQRDSWEVMLWAALQQRPLWAAAGVLVVLLVLCFVLRKRSHEPVSSGQEKYSSSNLNKTAINKGKQFCGKESRGDKSQHTRLSLWGLSPEEELGI